MQKILASIKQMIFPNLCVCCSEYLSHQEAFICDICLHTLSRFEQYMEKDNVVAQIFWGRVKLEFATALLSYGTNGDVQKVLHEIKYRNGKALGYFIGEWMGRVAKEQQLFNTIDTIIPIPLHPKKELLRGYNQCDLIVNGIMTELNKQVLNNVLIRTKNTSTQTKKKRYERYINTSEIFAVVSPEQLKGKHILLVDDVVTTGATLEAAAGALLDVEGVKISVYALAKA